ncbi:NB-ARC domain-containing protein [Nostoc sp. CALU 1950]|uniref:NB-ARC domain-containing protein n=1 Tax=Nostoc sp. CALU 1950 TaxID=3104321 RepID=UPI003EB929B3
MELSPQPLRKPKYPPELLREEDNCANIRDTLEKLRDELIQTRDPIELNRINKDIARLKKDLEDCENFYTRREPRSGNIDRSIGDWSDSWESVPYYIPGQDPNKFVERSELDKLRSWLIPDNDHQWTNLVCIVGSVGVGKSTLAFHFAQEYYKDRFADGALYQDVNGKSIEEVAHRFLKHCKIEDDNPIDRLTKLFQQRRMLFIFDNADSEEIQELFPSGRQCAAIVTTRDRRFCENLQMKRILLKSFSSEKNGIDLLTKKMGETGEQRIKAELNAAHQIVHLLGNLPLALSIAGSTLGIDTSFSLSDYVDFLNEARLDSLSQEEDIKRNIRACFKLSIKQLKPESSNLFACLSVCGADGFTGDAAIAAGGRTAFETRIKLLPEICRYSLLDNDNLYQDNYEVRQRYRLQTLLREFAKELAEERCLLTRATSRHEEFINQIHEIKALGELANGSSEKIIKELDNIIYAAEWLKEKRICEYSFGFRFCKFFDRNINYNNTAIKLMSIFRELAEIVKDWEYIVQFGTEQAKYMMFRNRSLNEHQSRSSDLRKILKLLKPIQNFLNLFESSDKWLIEARYRSTYADLLDADGQYQNALIQLRLVIKLYKKNKPQGVAKALTNVGSILQKQRKYQAAVKELREAVNLEKQMFDNGDTIDESGWATALANLGIALKDWGREYWTEAVNILRQSNELNEKLGHKTERNLSKSLLKLGELLGKLEQFEDANASFERSLLIKQKPEINDTKGINILIDRWFQLLQDIQEYGDRQDSLIYCNRAIKIIPKTHQAKFLQLREELESGIG